MALLRCTAPFAVMVNGVPRVVTSDELVDSSDPIVKGREQYFETVETYMAAKADRVTSTEPGKKVEQATAAPNEKRSVGRPRKATAGKGDES